jgi:hypothetical protein
LPRLAAIAGTVFLLGSSVYVDPSLKLSIKCVMALVVLACLVRVWSHRQQISRMYLTLPQQRREQIQIFASCILLFAIIWFPLAEPIIFALFVLVFGLDYAGYALVLGALAGTMLAMAVVAYWAHPERRTVGSFIRLSLAAWAIGFLLHAVAVVID